MNRHCRGVFFILDGAEKYRCSLNGEFISGREVTENRDSDILICPLCNREIHLADCAGEVEKRTKIIEIDEVLLPGYGWEEFQRWVATRGDDKS